MSLTIREHEIARAAACGLPRPRDGSNPLDGFTSEHQAFVRRVCDDYGFQPARLFTRARDAKTSMARHICMALLYWHTGLSLKDIGGMFERDHGTVIHARDRLLKAFRTGDAVIPYIEFLEALHFGIDHENQQVDRERLDKRCRFNTLPVRWQRK